MTKDELKERVENSIIEKLKVPLKIMPLWMEATALGVFIDKVLLDNPRLAKKLGELEGKTFLFEATDVEKGFFLKIEATRVKVIPHMSKEPDVVMKGEFKTLCGLLLGKEDADTVFFSRKLQINGDTAVALHLKNILNSM